MSTFDSGSAPSFKPGIGQHVQNGSTGISAPIFRPTYADLGTIQNLIRSTQSDLNSLQQSLISTMDGLALPVTLADTTLAAAIASTWPAALGTPPNYVTFNYYNYLLNQNSSAATLITKAYLVAAQDVGGNDAIDLLSVVQVLINEVSFINGFVTNNLSGGIDDSSEQRAAELFQDLLSSISIQIQNAQRIFQNQGSILSTTETAQLSQTDSQNAQALFQVNLNKLNVQLNQDIHVLNTNFAFSAQTFYTQFLEPALQFRKNVSSKILPMYKGIIGAAINTSISASNQNLQSALVDQHNRIQFLANQVDAIMNDIINRDAYRNWIQQLSPQGVSVPSGLSGQMVQAVDSTAALVYFENAAVGAFAATPSFTANHNTLDNLLAPEAHPQYLTIDAWNAATPSWYSPTQTGGLPSTDDLSTIANTNPTVGNVSLNGHKLTNVEQGTDPTDVATVAQIAMARLTPFVYRQDIPSAIATISHNLGYNPSINIVTLSGEEVIGNIVYIDNNNVMISFIAPFSWIATMI